MRPEASDVMSPRAANQPLVQTSIRSTARNRMPRAVELIDTIFGLLPAVYGDPQLRTFPAGKNRISTDTVTESWIAKEFYSSHYCDVDINNDFAGYKITLSEFIDRITYFNSSDSRNTVFYLQGEIGSGKTALINRIITNDGNRLFKQSNIWFFRINADLMRMTDGRGLDSFLEKLEDKLFTILEKLITRHVSDIPNPDIVSRLGKVLSAANSHTGSPQPDARIARVKLSLTQISEILDKRLLIIIDNLDFIVHEEDRFQFLKPKEDIRSGYLLAIRQIIAAFYAPDSSLSDIGANVLFVLRSDTYTLLKTTHALAPVFRGSYADNRSLYTVKGPDWNDVVEQRAALLKRCSQNIQPDGLRNDVIRHTMPLIAALSDKNRTSALFRHLRAISIYGLRGVLNFFCDYTWYPANSSGLEDTITTRFVNSHQLGLIAFMLNNRILYSQNDAHFPNIFFSNIISDEETEIIESTYISSTGPRNISRNHWHTYWLKKMMLEFIRARNESGAALNPDDIYDVFCRDIDHNLGFTEDIVRLCLGSFSQTHLSNLISVSKTLTGDDNHIRIEDIYLSDRAKHCLDHVFDTFPYLQLIVDDYLIPLPRVWIKDFRVSNELHYGYLTEDPSIFALKSRLMVLEKSKKVTRFLAMLSAAFDAERRTKPRLFEVFKREHIVLRSAEDIFEGVLNELEAISGASAMRDSSKFIDVDTSVLRTEFVTWRNFILPVIMSAYGVPD